MDNVPDRPHYHEWPLTDILSGGLEVPDTVKMSPPKSWPRSAHILTRWNKVDNVPDTYYYHEWPLTDIWSGELGCQTVPNVPTQDLTLHVKFCPFSVIDLLAFGVNCQATVISWPWSEITYFRYYFVHVEHLFFWPCVLGLKITGTEMCGLFKT